ncbi:hypothetical protein GCM10010289_81780 [Streptomyces violascens]|uniref:Uncharacterized protein n=1 Tax=Streptomyces violascens TaxID=67381 RepID=A0ABQ3QRG3_9ACTN|nr:hypothetical protein GCM10010289_81780 [Streptomyces violascens]GHI39867.1 hypothetical protein Sviol_42750 [Streptomyces violascens]
MLDGNARLNLATFVATWVEPSREQARPGQAMQLPYSLAAHTTRDATSELARPANPTLLQHPRLLVPSFLGLVRDT